MFKVIIIPNFASSLLFPENFECILNAMFGCSGCIGNGAIVGFWCLGKSIQQGTLIAWCFIRLDQQCLSLKSLSCSIDVIASSFLWFLIDLKHNTVEIFSGFNVIETSDDNWKLQIFSIRYVLDTFTMCCYLDTWTTFAHKWCNSICLWLSHIFLPEHELSVQIREINCVHVD